MSVPQYSSAADRLDDEQLKGPSMVDPTPFVGTWINTNDSARHKIARVVISIKDGSLVVHAFGDCSPDLCDWGEVVADVFAESIGSHEAMSFSAVYDFGFMESYLQSNVKHGTLVIATCNKFKDDNGRSNYYTREFFYQTADE
ncbi:MAG: hypothetical protein DMF72_02535 [Acidobacteria bacterium]|nr:MAG: hypothetical protein DMF72_02535 [Acidobacteriota bacterium]